MHLYCQCLNVTIDVLEINDNQEIQTHFPVNELMRFINLSDGWLACKLSSEFAIHVAWHSLFQSINIRDIKLNRCLACNQYTHITFADTNRLLINEDLLDDKTVEQVYLDPNYSSVAKIVLPARIQDLPIKNTPGSQDEIFQRECELVQQLYRQSIEDADREMEENIQIHQKEQEQILQGKTQAIQKELETFLSFMRALPTLQTSNPYMNENSMESGFGSDIFDANGNDSSRQSSTFERALSERTSNLDEDTIDDPMFENTDWFPTKDKLPNFATSLPKTIAFRSYSIPQPNQDDNHSLERIGQSFRELSKSLMCTDGTELFGDLPSPRVNIRQT